jgi:hypothetical protein
MVKPNSSVINFRKTRIITQVLTTAIKLWLRTQLSQVSAMEVQIKADDRQILSGCIPWVSIFASHAVYQGLHITQIELTAENIQVNIGSILRGKPLSLLETVSVIGEMIIKEVDLNHCLSSDLFTTALQEVIIKLLPEQSQKSNPVNWRKITIENSRFCLEGIQTTDNKPKLFKIITGLELLNGQSLQLAPIHIQQDQAVIISSNSGYSIYLGTDVDLQEINLITGELICRGRINVNP